MRFHEYDQFSTLIFLISTFLLIKCVVSCSATNGGTTPTNPCTTCADLQVITGNALDQTPVVTVGTDPTTGCETVTVFCQGTSTTSDVILLWTLNGADQGSSTDGPATGSITRTLTCNGSSQLFLSDNGFTGQVTAVECLSS